MAPASAHDTVTAVAPSPLGKRRAWTSTAASSISSRRRTLAIAAGWALVPVLLWLRLGANGYNTTDYGFIIGQSWRVLHGEFPHSDFISARPAGSAYLHVVDFVLPLALIDSSRLVALAIITLIGLASGVAVFGCRPHRWSLTGHLVVLTAVLFTLNTFQVGAWYTADGMLFALASVAGLRLWSQRRDAGLPALALLSAGVAPLMKQSFFLSVPLAVVWTLVVLHRAGTLTWSRTVRVGLLAGAPGLSYVALVAVGGGLGPMISQLTSATKPQWTGTLGTFAALAPPAAAVILLLAVVAVTCVLWLPRVSLLGAGRRAGLTGYLSVLGYLTAVGLGAVAHFDMYDSTWSSRLFWCAVATSVIAGVAQGQLRGGDLGVIAVAWMTVLSWGMPWPLLSAGGLLLVIAQCLAQPAGNVLLRSTLHATRKGARRVWTVGAVIGLVLTAVVLDDSIQHRVVHRDQPAAELHTPLKSLDSDFGRATTNPSTAALVRDAVDCRRAHPASGVVFGSWNSDLYAILGIRNPLATDGANNYEITGAEEQYRASVRELGRRGDYLVLFPLINPEGVHEIEQAALPRATATTPIPEYWFSETVPYSWMSEQLPGTRVACGTWIGIYQPAQT